MLTPDDLARIAEVVRQELARTLHPSIQRPVQLPEPANDTHTPTPTEPAA